MAADPAPGRRWQQNGSQPVLLTFSGENNRPDPDGKWSFDAAGGLSGDGVNTYCYDGAGRLLDVVAGVNQACTTANWLALYTYDAAGERVTVNAGGADTDSLWWRGRRLAERTGPLAASDWQDFIYANGRRIARAASFADQLRIWGTVCANCGWQYSGFSLPDGSWTGYVIQPGDRLAWRQYQASGTHGGLKLIFSDGSDSNWGVVSDQDGDALNDDPTQLAWHPRAVDLSPVAGRTIRLIALLCEGTTAAGPYEIDYRDLVLIGADGTVRPIYTGQAAVALAAWGPEGGTTRNAAAVHLSGEGADPTLTHWFHGDQLGTSRLVTQADGYPLWQGAFLPFGEEFQPQPAVSPFKFTGQPRDPETGLDDFGARDYTSTLGRFMTPDWSAQAEPVPYAKLDHPQSLNLYAYVLNNPVTSVDKDGHDCDVCEITMEEVDRVARRLIESAASAGETAGASALGVVGFVLTPTPAGGRNDVVHFPGTPQQKASNGQKTDQHGNKLGPSGKPLVRNKNFPTKKRARDAARNDGKGAPIHHPTPTRGLPHFHPNDGTEDKAPGSCHYNYPKNRC